MKDSRSPQFLSDLFRDLRDRRLLIPAVALIVGLLAVPVALSSDPQPSAAPAVAGIEDAAQVQPAVLAEQAGIRNYRKRLAKLKSKNPFEQKFTLPEAAAGDASVEVIGDPSSGVETIGSGSSDATVSGSVDVTTGTDASTSTSTSDGSSSGGTEPTKTVTKIKKEVSFYTGRIDITVGELGDAKKLKGVKGLSFLPSDKNPLLVFVGVSEDATRAIFSVSSDVTDTDGDGSCSPKQPHPCQYLALEPGEQRYLHTASGKTFRLSLLDIDVVKVADPRE